jgi:hypothetical protein
VKDKVEEERRNDQELNKTIHDDVEGARKDTRNPNIRKNH